MTNSRELKIDSLNLIKLLAPEMLDLLELRYSILRSISYNGPIGRRSLAEKLKIQERTVRNEANLLKKQGLLNIELMGMSITGLGSQLLEELHPLYMDLKGIPELEELVRARLNIKDVKIVAGDFGKDSTVLKEMGKLGSEVLKKSIKKDSILGITGGTTMYSVSEECIRDNKKRDIIVVPARGGLGKDIYTQSNSLAVNLAEKLGGSYRLLYVVDGLEEEALKYMMKNEEIKETLDLIENMDTLIFGIGRADEMAKRRNLSDDRIYSLLEEGAVAESFGHFFDIEGNELWEYKTIGMSLDKYKKIDNAIAVAGGVEKAEAIIAVSTLNKNMQLITDELTARKILKIKDS